MQKLPTLSRRGLPLLAQLALSCLTTAPLHALILYSGLNSENLSAPDSEREAIFDAVASVCNSSGSSRNGSAVRIRGKYMLTARHVSTSSHVTFDGSTFWARDTAFTPITFDDVDLKLFKLIEDPGITEIELHSSDAGDDVSSGFSGGRPPFNLISTEVTGTLVGWGRGSSENGSGFVEGDDQTWTWANTYSKRWGTNRIDSSTTISDIDDYDYSYTGLSIDLDSDAGTDEAGLAVHDSGSGIFVENDGIWRLAGIATLVTTDGSSTFSSSGQDNNFFVRISNYASEIEAAIPDLNTLSGWKTDHSLYGADADNDADTDGDGIGQLLEYALGGDPNVNDISILPRSTLVEENGNQYLEISLTRPTGLTGISYLPQTSSDLNNWPSDSSGIVDASPTPGDNGDGTETLIYRRSQAVTESDQAFIRIEVIEN